MRAFSTDASLYRALSRSLRSLDLDIVEISKSRCLPEELYSSASGPIDPFADHPLVDFIYGLGQLGLQTVTYRQVAPSISTSRSGSKRFSPDTKVKIGIQVAFARGSGPST